MGACFIWTQLKPELTATEVKETFKQMVQTAEIQSGSEYSGDWNMMDGIVIEESNILESKQKAIEYLEDNTGKWDNALAVRFHGLRNNEKYVGWLVGGWAAE